MNHLICIVSTGCVESEKEYQMKIFAEDTQWDISKSKQMTKKNYALWI